MAKKHSFKNWIKKHRMDLLLAIGLLCIAGILLLVFHVQNSKPGKYLLVKSQGKTLGAYRLDIDQTPDCLTNFYEGSNQLVIENGTAYIKEANCKRQICVKMHPVSKVGEMIICLPNELFLTVTDQVEGSVKILGIE